MAKIGRPPGSKNGIKSKPVAPQVQLQKIIADETLPLEARQSALQALESVTAPEPPLAPQRIYIEQWNKTMCACDPFADDSERCAACNAEWHAADAARVAREAALAQEATRLATPSEEAALQRDLDALEEGLL